MLKQLWHALPFSCLLCQHPIEPYQSKTKLRAPWCAICAEQFPTFIQCPRCGLESNNHQLDCGKCLTKPPVWDSLTCVSDYLFPYDKLLHQFKYKGQFWLAPHLIALLPPISHNSSVVMPVPMHWKRKIVRGFNHSQLLANAFAKRFDLNIINGIKRIRATKKQQGLSRKERLKNLNHAFSLIEPAPLHVTLVDDVITTGATITQLSQLLRAHGTKKIDIICICRTSSEKPT